MVLQRQQLQMQQLMAHLQTQEAYQKLTPAQQQTMLLQMMLKQNALPISDPLQQQAAAAASQGPQQPASTAPSTTSPTAAQPASAANSGPPAFHRSLSQPGDQGNIGAGLSKATSSPAVDDTSSIWGRGGAAPATTQPQQSWSQPGSVWDLPHPASKPPGRAQQTTNITKTARIS